MKKVLFVCTANIHRSRFAEEVFNYLCAKHNKDYHAFSAGLRVGDYSFRKIYYPALENLKAFNIIPTRPDDLSKHIKDVELENYAALDTWEAWWSTPEGDEWRQKFWSTGKYIEKIIH